MPDEQGNYSADEWKGLLGDKQNEVRNRQQAHADLAVSKKTIEELNAKIKELSTKKEVGDPEDIMTRAEVLRLMKAQRNEMTDEYTKAETTKSKKSQEARIEASFEKAKGKYTVEKAGKGLTFDEVWEGTQRVIKDEPDQGAIIAKSKNPGEKAYEIGLRDSVIAKRLATYKKTLPPPGKADKEGLGGTTVPGAFYSQEMVKKMSEAQIKEHYPEIQESMKKWDKK